MLIRAGIAPQSSYDNELKNPRNVYPEQYNEEHSDKYKNCDISAVRALSSIIDNDDSDALQEYLSHPSRSVDMTFFTIPHFSMYSCPISGDVSLIDYAAYRGMVKCFKYLLLNGAKLTKGGEATSMTYAICGGNIEIIHIVEEQHLRRHS